MEAASNRPGSKLTVSKPSSEALLRCSGLASVILLGRVNEAFLSCCEVSSNGVLYGGKVLLADSGLLSGLLMPYTGLESGLLVPCFGVLS